MAVASGSREGSAGGRRRRLRIAAAALLAAVFVVSLTVWIQASASEKLIVTFTFDDGVTDQLLGQQLLQHHGMAGTFYINSALVGRPGFMTRAQLEDLEAHGHEIGGHTVSHQRLTTLARDEQNRQICQDRNALLTWGFPVTSFAYPFVDFDPAVKAIVRGCGYNNARSVGDLRSPFSCPTCRATETIPPADPYAIRTPDDVQSNWTLSDLQNLVLHAEEGGGWLPLNLHHVCVSGCPVASISSTVFDQFLTWLQPRSATKIGTTVRTVRQVVGGAVRPAVAPATPPPPGAPGVNTVHNASLETAGTLDPNLPDCWSVAANGANKATQTRVTDAHSGTYASRLVMTSRTAGTAKLVPRFDLGQCSLPVAAGRTYQVSAWYKSDVPVFFTVYRRNPIGQWSYWAQSPRHPPSPGWTRATWTTPAAPSDAVAVSFGLAMDSVGTLTTDDYGFADNTPTPAPPGVNALPNPSLETAGADGFPQCWTAASNGTNKPTWSRVTDAADGRYAERLEITSWTDGAARLVASWDSGNCAPLVTVGATYTLSVSYKATTPTFMTLYRQDAAGKWAHWAQSPDFRTADRYTTATWTTPPVPLDTRAATFGLTLNRVGVVITDNYRMIGN